jgi:hypothetical protein
MLLFLGRGKVAYLKSLKRTFQLKQNTSEHSAFELNQGLGTGKSRYSSVEPMLVGTRHYTQMR